MSLVCIRRGLVLATVVALGACKGDDKNDHFGGGGTDDTQPGDGGGGDDGGTGTGTGSGGVKLDVGPGDTDGGGDDGGCPPIDGDATLTGTVFAPNQTLPISGALVYVSDAEPDPIPQTVYCAECVELTCDTPWTFTEPDGSFELEVHSGTQHVVVQKGQFMRVTELDVAAGTTPLGPDVTSLPDHNHPGGGLFVPRIAVAIGDHDRIEDDLAKLGLAQTMIQGYEESTVDGTEQFELWDNSPQVDHPASKGSFAQLVQNYALMEPYHVIFVPCTQQAGEYPAVLDDPQVIDNIRRWVAAGGKWYVSDWSAEAMWKPFAQYQEFWRRRDGTPDVWQGDESTDLGRYDPMSTVLDPDLLAWLEALPSPFQDINPLNDPAGDPFPTLADLPDLQAIYAYSGVKDVPPVLVDDGMGGMVDVGHKVWIEGEGSETWGAPPPGTMHPLTITAEYGCGRIMFTAYHTVERGDYVGLSPQELVLMYLILEIGVCQTPYEPPPPEG